MALTMLRMFKSYLYFMWEFVLELSAVQGAID
jgi:hypothetical protein